MPAHIGYIIIEHDMDVALRVVESGDDDAQRRRSSRRARPAEIESDRGSPGTLSWRWSCLISTAPAASSAPVLQVSGLNVYYGHSHALQGVDLTLDHGVLSVVGRNGMGKTTLCQAIMGLVPSSSGRSASPARN